MRVVLTGTPGTGKTTASDRLPHEVVHLNAVIEREGLWTERDEGRDSLVVDLDGLRAWVDDAVGSTDDEGVVVLESHLAHLLDADRVVVLRCRPDVLESRLRERGESAEKARENAESEALDVILTEAVDAHGSERVYEIDTTDRSPDAVAAEVEAVVAGDRDPSAGDVDFLDYLHS
ncbi:adenylate kinase family protein [Salinigranum marinum]|uniref:adenylate kinase family protein n=1 Tax=Salinigranum marinum TaxID=1515595 RepID=UPI002989C2C3|nr:adenylate kinase family protein [Salinigranum marinum]